MVKGGKLLLTPVEILEKTIKVGVEKTQKTLLAQLVLGFIGGAMISLGYLAYVRVSASVPSEFSSIGTLIGASVFPIGLIVIVLAGGELITGNMMAVSTSWIAKKISLSALVRNFVIITLANVVGALFVAYFFGYSTGLTTTGIFGEYVAKIAHAKIAATPWQAFLSGIGCNWFVGLAVYMSYGAKDAAGKIMAMWFPVMTFVAIGFQHSVANMFIIPAAIFAGDATWMEFLTNFIPVYAGNIVGGLVFIGLFYNLAYGDHLNEGNK